MKLAICFIREAKKEVKSPQKQIAGLSETQ